MEVKYMRGENQLLQERLFAEMAWSLKICERRPSDWLKSRCMFMVSITDLCFPNWKD